MEFQSAGVSFHQTLKRELGGKNFIVKDRDGNFLLFAGPADKSVSPKPNWAQPVRRNRTSAEQKTTAWEPATMCQEPTFLAVLCEPTAALPLSDSPNIRNLAKGCFGAALEDDRALPHGDVARGRESLPRRVHVAAAERELAFATQPIDFRQIEPDAGLVGCRAGVRYARRALRYDLPRWRRGHGVQARSVKSGRSYKLRRSYKLPGAAAVLRLVRFSASTGPRCVTVARFGRPSGQDTCAKCQGPCGSVCKPGH